MYAFVGFRFGMPNMNIQYTCLMIVFLIDPPHLFGWTWWTSMMIMRCCETIFSSWLMMSASFRPPSPAHLPLAPMPYRLTMATLLKWQICFWEPHETAGLVSGPIFQTFRGRYLICFIGLVDLLSLLAFLQTLTPRTWGSLVLRCFGCAFYGGSKENLEGEEAIKDPSSLPWTYI